MVKISYRTDQETFKFIKMKEASIKIYRDIIKEITKEFSKEEMNKIVSISNKIVKLERKKKIQ